VAEKKHTLIATASNLTLANATALKAELTKKGFSVVVK
jgi:hypothetical protein